MTSPSIPLWLVEYVTSKDFRDAVRKVVDASWLAENVPLTGAKAEGSGAKLEATAGSLSFFGAQGEYTLFKHEYAVFDLEKRRQEKRDKEIDGSLERLGNADTSIKSSIEQAEERIGRNVRVGRDTDANSRRLRDQEVDGRLARHAQTDASIRSWVDRVQQRLAARSDGIRREQRAGDQRLRAQISGLQTRINNVSRVAHAADQRSKSVRVKASDAEGKAKAALKQVSDLRKQVHEGMQRVHGLENSATRTSQAIKGLRRDLNDLDQSLRD